MQKTYFYRGLFYLMGLLILALGITLNTKTGLGVSPIISVHSVSLRSGILILEILHWFFMLFLLS